jgi:hypothetical protein
MASLADMLVSVRAPREGSGSTRSCPDEPDGDDEDSDWRSAL